MLSDFENLMDLRKELIVESVVHLINWRQASYYRAIPIRLEEGGLLVAVENTYAPGLAQIIEYLSGGKVCSLTKVTGESFEWAINKFYEKPNMDSVRLKKIELAQGKLSTKESAYIQVLGVLIEQAIFYSSFEIEIFHPWKTSLLFPNHEPQVLNGEVGANSMKTFFYEFFQTLKKYTDEYNGIYNLSEFYFEVFIDVIIQVHWKLHGERGHLKFKIVSNFSALCGPTDPSPNTEDEKLDN